VLLSKLLIGTMTTAAVPGRREMNAAIPVVRDLHLSKIRGIIADCYPEFTIIMDGTPVFAEAECVMLRFVHKTNKKIYEFVVHLGLYAESLDGNTIAKHVADVLTGGRLSLQLKHLKATSVDRAATNKRAMTVLHDDHGISPFRAYCVSHGTSGCGKKAKMTVGADAVKHLSGMVKFQLCKARNVFFSKFGESAKKNGGVRWGVFHELCEQTNRIGLANLRDEYASVCLANEWSKSSAGNFLESIADDYNFCIASVEIAAVVDVGHSLISETYICESKECGAFTVWEGITKLRTLFGRGIEGFDNNNGFVELDKRAKEAADIIDLKFLVSKIFNLFIVHFNYPSLSFNSWNPSANRHRYVRIFALPPKRWDRCTKRKQLHSLLWTSGPPNLSEIVVEEPRSIMLI
jgi:hypothetical protein